MLTDNQTTEDKKFDPKAPRKKVLTPPGKPVPKEPDGAVTPRGKNLQIVFDKQYGLYMVEFTEGGAVPQELSGKYTEEKRAKDAIEQYLRGYWKNRT